MSKYTPGPWKVDKVIKPRYDSDTGEKLKDDVRVFIYPDNPKKENFNLAVVNSYCVAEHEANARLIAASPSMHDRLDRIIEEFANTGKVSEQSIREAQELLRTIEPDGKYAR